MDRSPLGSSVHRILQARILERIATPYSRGSSQRRDGSASLTSTALIGRFPLVASGKLKLAKVLKMLNLNPFFLSATDFSLSILLQLNSSNELPHALFPHFSSLP